MTPNTSPQLREDNDGVRDPKAGRGPSQHRGTFLTSFGWAGAGLAHAFRSQRNLRLQILGGIAAAIVGVVLGLPAAELATLALAITLVLSLEVMNTALEAVVDLATPELHPLARAAKDAAAGAVLVASVGAVAVGLLLLGPRLLARLGY